MKITIISDTHGYFPKVPGGDILIHCGDYSMSGHNFDLIKFRNWFSAQNYRYKILVAGNHDLCLQENYYKKFIEEYPDIIYLEDRLVTIEGLRIYGAPWTPTFMNWAFMLDRGTSIASKWELIPENLDILITHGPPYGILDWSIYSNIPVGCQDLLLKVLSVKPKYHVFGHIHGSYGAYSSSDISTKFINAAQVSEQYRLVNKPVEIEL